MALYSTANKKVEKKEEEEPDDPAMKLEERNK
jgi:hypothetical protein